MQQHNHLAILVAAIVAFLIGGLWYSPMLFAKQWMAAHAHTPEDVAKMKADAPRAYGISLVAFLVMGAILQLFLNHLGVQTWQGGVPVGRAHLARICRDDWPDGDRLQWQEVFGVRDRHRISTGVSRGHGSDPRRLALSAQRRNAGRGIWYNWT